MKRALFALLACTAVAASGDAFRQFRKNGARNTGVLLSYLPTVAASDECTGTSPTGTRGETLTFTRASSGYCTKTDGTLVLLTANQPRIQPAGLLVEPAATNKCIHSEEFENWTPTDASSNVDSDTAPNGATEVADTLSSSPAGGFLESTAAALVGAAAIASVYVKTSAGTQAMAIRLRDTTAGADACTGTLTATTTWQRVRCLGLITSTNTHAVRVYPGGTGGAGTVIAWGAQMEVTGDGNTAALASSYVATAGTSVARALDNASLALPASASQSAGCVGVTLSRVTQLTVANQRFLDFNGSNPINHNNHLSITADDGTAFPGNLTVPTLYSNTNRVTFNWGGSIMYLESASATAASADYDGTMWVAATLFIGLDAGGAAHAYASLSDIKVGIRPGACL